MDSGTVVAVLGRGDDPRALSGLADRLALDGYRVLVHPGPRPDPTDLAALAASARHPGPVILLGVDTGVAAVLDAARHRVPVAGLVLAGMPGDRPLRRDEADEAAVRIRDPGRRALLRSGAEVRFGELLAHPVPFAVLDRLFDDTVTVPTLVLHGDTDPLCPFPLASRRALRLRRSRVITLVDTAHDVFRDTHRASAAAEVLLFAEQLRGGAAAPSPVRVLLRSTW